MQNYAVRYLLYQSMCTVLPTSGLYILIRILYIFNFWVVSACRCRYAAEQIMMIQLQGVIELQRLWSSISSLLITDLLLYITFFSLFFFQVLTCLRVQILLINHMVQIVVQWPLLSLCLSLPLYLLVLAFIFINKGKYKLYIQNFSIHPHVGDFFVFSFC